VDTLTPHLATLNAHLTALHAALPARTALVIFTGHDDPRRMAHLNARKVRFEREIKGGKSLEDVPRAEWWSAQEGRELEQVVEEAKRGLVFVGVKG
jgi:RNA exonuclease 1